ncbi:hypothetical protein [Anaplasma marginale]|uniref:hypothetical protein n=1 Tax=Anaplasma marginale TaxID=770 RepID=UPI0011459473|nr:hypothetical protein [Anaplasma marginale]
MTDVSDSLGKATGKDQKKIALLIRNTNKIQTSQQVTQICSQVTSVNKHELIGIGLLQEINSNQFSEKGLAKNALVPIGCISQNGGSNSEQLGIAGNSSNF